MNLEWSYNCDNVNWDELSKGHSKIILYSNPGKEEFYSKLGFDRMNTAMAIFKNKDQAIESQLTRKTPNE